MSKHGHEMYGAMQRKGKQLRSLDHKGKSHLIQFLN